MQTTKTKHLKELAGARMELDVLPQTRLTVKLESCPWNEASGTADHLCTVRGVSSCPYFMGTKYPDTVLCTFAKSEKRA